MLKPAGLVALHQVVDTGGQDGELHLLPFCRLLLLSSLLFSSFLCSLSYSSLSFSPLLPQRSCLCFFLLTDGHGGHASVSFFSFNISLLLLLLLDSALSTTLQSWHEEQSYDHAITVQPGPNQAQFHLLLDNIVLESSQVIATSSMVNITSYQQYMNPNPVYGVPVLTSIGRERSDGLFSGFINICSHLTSCFCLCFRTKRLPS